MSERPERLKHELRRRVLILDAAAARAPTGDGFVASLEAGADIVLAGTLWSSGGEAPSAERIEAAAADLGSAPVSIARRAANEFTRRDPARPRFVAGLVDLTLRPAAPGGAAAEQPVPSEFDLLQRDLDRLEKVCRDQAAALLDGGVDMLYLAGAGDGAAARTAIAAIGALLEERRAALPVWVAAVAGDGRRSGAAPDPTTRLPSGQSITGFCIALGGAGWPSLEIDSATIGDDLATTLRDCSAITRGCAALVVTGHSANARGTPLPVADAPAWVATLRRIVALGHVNIIGRGPGTTREEFSALIAAAEGLTPGEPPTRPHGCWVSGRDPLLLRRGSGFVRIGERTNVTGSARFARLIREGRFADALAIARSQVAGGAQILDVNMDHSQLDGAAAMSEFLVRLAGDPDAGRVPVMIDSANWEVLEAGLHCLAGRGILNSISLKDGEEEFRRRARIIRRHGAVPLAIALDPAGPALDCDRKVATCTRAFRILTEQIGFHPEEVILDPAILAIGTGLPEHGDLAGAYIEACRALRQTLPGCLISGGVSNLSFVYRGHDTVRSAMHAVFLQHAIPAGMDMGIVNLDQLPEYDEIPGELREAAEDVILNRRPDAAIRLARSARKAARTEGDD